MYKNASSYLLTSQRHSTCAWVEVDEKKAKIYGIKQERNKVSGYIESKEGAEFNITVLDDQKNPPFDRVTRLILDGNLVDGFISTKGEAKYRTAEGHTKRELFFEGTEVGENLGRPFVFGKLRLTDDEAISCKEENIIDDLGKIQIKIWRTREGDGLKTEAWTEPVGVIVHETSRKASISHQIQFKEAVATDSEECSSFYFDFIDPPDKPQLVFEFQYLSRDLLILKGFIDAPEAPIAPIPAPEEEEQERQPSTPPAQDNVQDSSDDDEDNQLLAELESQLEIKLLEARIKETKNRLLKRKERKQADDEKNNKKVKVEVKKEIDHKKVGTIIIDDSDSD